MYLARSFERSIRMNTNSSSETTSYEYLIFGGPNRDTLFDACKYAYDKDAVIPIFFAVAESYTAPLNGPICDYTALEMDVTSICGISHEDGSGVKLIVDGYCIAKFSNSLNGRTTCSFRAFYNTKTHEGQISFHL